MMYSHLSWYGGECELIAASNGPWPHPKIRGLGGYLYIIHILYISDVLIIFFCIHTCPGMVESVKRIMAASNGPWAEEYTVVGSLTV